MLPSEGPRYTVSLVGAWEGKTMNTFRRAIALASLLVLGAYSAAAHHSFAVFDHTQTLTIRGTVTKYQWTNPHGLIEIDYTASDGSVKQYTIELTSINMLSRAGWTSRSVKAGEKVKAIVAPLLSGEPGGLLLEVTFSDGRTLESPVPAPNSFNRTPEKELK
jgi:hypothetical protein